MHEPYIKSSIADVASIRMDGSRYGGATVAAMFLHKFAVAAGIKKHVHLDIASRMDVPKGSDLAGPSLGEPVPLLVQAIREF
jgi:leucyl aminopeptidase